MLVFLSSCLFSLSFPLQAFSVVFEKAIDRAEPAEEVKARVINLIDCITYSVYVYTARGLFEKDKLIFTVQMCFTVCLALSSHIQKKNTRCILSAEHFVSNWYTLDVETKFVVTTFLYPSSLPLIQGKQLCQ